MNTNIKIIIFLSIAYSFKTFSIFFFNIAGSYTYTMYTLIKNLVPLVNKCNAPSIVII